MTAGLSELTIEQTSSEAPPAGGSQSSQPTLPGAALHRATVRTVFQGQAVEPGIGLLLPSQPRALTGIARGKTAHQSPWLEPQ